MPLRTLSQMSDKQPTNKSKRNLITLIILIRCILGPIAFFVAGSLVIYGFERLVFFVFSCFSQNFKAPPLILLLLFPAAASIMLFFQGVIALIKATKINEEDL